MYSTKSPLLIACVPALQEASTQGRPVDVSHEGVHKQLVDTVQELQRSKDMIRQLQHSIKTDNEKMVREGTHACVCA
jgi:hypothetical protein